MRRWHKACKENTDLSCSRGEEGPTWMINMDKYSIGNLLSGFKQTQTGRERQRICMDEVILSKWDHVQMISLPLAERARVNPSFRVKRWGVSSSTPQALNWRGGKEKGTLTGRTSHLFFFFYLFLKPSRGVSSLFCTLHLCLGFFMGSLSLSARACLPPSIRLLKPGEVKKGFRDHRGFTIATDDLRHPFGEVKAKLRWWRCLY